MYHIVVRTRYQDLFDSFLKSFLATTKDFQVKLYVLHFEKDHIVIPKIEGVESIVSESLGNQAYIPLLHRIMDEVKLKTDDKNYGYFGMINDDIIFSPDWLQDVDDALQFCEAVTPGYINTKDREKFYRAVEKSKNETDVIYPMMGSAMFMRINIFPRIGMLDPQFDWACEDFDLIWRLKLNGMKSVTLKKISIMHYHGASRVKDMARWNVASDQGKQMFYDKHGIESYRQLVRDFKSHEYFLNYEC